VRDDLVLHSTFLVLLWPQIHILEIVTSIYIFFLLRQAYWLSTLMQNDMFTSWSETQVSNFWTSRAHRPWPSLHVL
jgi:hypothetical protein